MSSRRGLTQRGWWASFVLLLGTALVFSVVVGDHLARLGEPEEMGATRTGEWADLSAHGFRARLEGITMATQLPSAYNPDVGKSAPPGMSYLSVRMTIVPTVGPDGDLACRFTMVNGEGEQLTLTEYGVEGPEYGECLHPSQGTREKGAAYETQTVYIVVAEPVEAYTLQLHPLFAASPVYWSFTA